MENERWLQGGPFLEVSFFLENNSQDKQKIINDILDKIDQIQPKIEIINTIEEINNEKEEFIKGYLYDETNLNSPTIHSMPLKLFVHFKRKRRCLLDFSISSKDKAILVEFCFFGSNFDAPEWDQVGVREEEINEFKGFLIKLFEIYNFPVGVLGYEMDVTYLFNTEKSWPDEFSYDIKNLSISEVIGTNLDNFNCYDYLIVNENFINLIDHKIDKEKINNGFFIDKHSPIDF